LKSGTVVHATLIAAPSSTKNSVGERDPKMHQARNGDQWHFGLKVQIGMDADSGLVHTVTSTPVNDAAHASSLVHRKESDVFAVAGQGVAKREETQDIDANRHVALCQGKGRALDKGSPRRSGCCAALP
jgi:IS5 family transposase